MELTFFIINDFPVVNFFLRTQLLFRLKRPRYQIQESSRVKWNWSPWMFKVQSTSGFRISQPVQTPSNLFWWMHEQKKVRQKNDINMLLPALDFMAPPVFKVWRPGLDQWKYRDHLNPMTKTGAYQAKFSFSGSDLIFLNIQPFYPQSCLPGLLQCKYSDVLFLARAFCYMDEDEA